MVKGERTLRQPASAGSDSWLLRIFRRAPVEQQLREARAAEVKRDPWEPTAARFTALERWAYMNKIKYKVELSADQLKALPSQEQLGWKNTYQLNPQLEVGTMFKLPGSTNLKDTIVGVVVKAGDAPLDQVGGAALSLGDKFVKMHLVQLAPDPEI